MPFKRGEETRHRRSSDVNGGDNAVVIAVLPGQKAKRKVVAILAERRVI